MIRGKGVVEAQALLDFTLKEPAKPIRKLLDSAVSSAKNQNVEDLHISEIMVNEGRTMKRWRPSAQGRTSPILKRSSHIVLTLSEKKKVSNKSKK